MRSRLRPCLPGLVVALAFSASTAPVAANNDSKHRLVWRQDWPKFRAWEYAVTGGLAAGGLTLEHLTEQPRGPRWDRPLLFDAPIREAVHAEHEKTRGHVAAASDVTWLFAQWYPTVVDALFVTLIGDKNFAVAWQMSWINAEANALGFVLTRGSHRLFGRSRPLRMGCKEDPAYDGVCAFPGNSAGFFSGHTSMAFVGAGLTCAHHQYLPLYGGGIADSLACAGTVLSASMTGILRMVADLHFASDVVVGAAVGFGVGYGIPRLLHYRNGASQEHRDPSLTASASAPVIPLLSGEF